MIAHYWHELPGDQWFEGADIYRDQVKRAGDGAVFVELGAWKGRSAACMGVEIANSGKRIDFYSVDHWLGSPGEREHQEDEDVQSGRLHEVFLCNIATVRDHVRDLRSDSAAAATLFADSSVDFVYVDAEHTYDGVMRDIRAWWPKLKTGGLMAGDDWDFLDDVTQEYGTRRAVQEFFAARGLPIRLSPGVPHPTWRQWSVEKPAEPAEWRNRAGSRNVARLAWPQQGERS